MEKPPEKKSTKSTDNSNRPSTATFPIPAFDRKHRNATFHKKSSSYNQTSPSSSSSYSSDYYQKTTTGGSSRHGEFSLVSYFRSPSQKPVPASFVISSPSHDHARRRNSYSGPFRMWQQTPIKNFSPDLPNNNATATARPSSSPQLELIHRRRVYKSPSDYQQRRPKSSRAEHSSHDKDSEGLNPKPIPSLHSVTIPSMSSDSGGLGSQYPFSAIQKSKFKHKQLLSQESHMWVGSQTKPQQKSQASLPQLATTSRTSRKPSSSPSSSSPLASPRNRRDRKIEPEQNFSVDKPSSSSVPPSPLILPKTRPLSSDHSSLEKSQTLPAISPLNECGNIDNQYMKNKDDGEIHTNKIEGAKGFSTKDDNSNNGNTKVPDIIDTLSSVCHYSLSEPLLPQSTMVNVCSQPTKASNGEQNSKLNEEAKVNTGTEQFSIPIEQQGCVNPSEVESKPKVNSEETSSSNKMQTHRNIESLSECKTKDNEINSCDIKIAVQGPNSHPNISIPSSGKCKASSSSDSSSPTSSPVSSSSSVFSFSISGNKKPTKPPKGPNKDNSTQPMPPPTKPRVPKNIVMCFDGTAEKFGPDPFTNVLKFFRLLENQDPATQIVYYQRKFGFKKDFF